MGFDGTEREPLPSWRNIFKGSVAECVAMTLFVFFGCGAAASNVHKDANGDWEPASVMIIALQFGLGITVLAFATAHTSGGHINCAVTWALTLVGKCHPLRGVAYLVAQLVGSTLGAALLKATTTSGEHEGKVPEGQVLDRSGALGANGLQNPSVAAGNAFLVEAMGTLLLVIVVLETGVNGKSITTEGESMVMGNKQNLAPLPIGLAVFLAHVVCIPITGCSINPTRSFGPALVADAWDDHWIWWAGPLAGATLASLLWLLMQFLDRDGAVRVETDESKMKPVAEAEEAAEKAVSA